MARGSGLNLAGLTFTQGATFTISLVLARLLGTSDLGIYAQAYAILSLLQMVAMGGLHTGTMRFVSMHRAAAGNTGAVRGTIYLGLGTALATSMVLGLALHFAAPWLADSAFNEPRLALPLSYVALTLPAATFAGVALGATQGFRTMRASAGIGLILEPALRLGLTIALLALGRGLSGTMEALVVSNLIAAALAARYLRRLTGSGGPAPVYEVRRLYNFSSVSWLGSLANSGLAWMDTIILGLYLPSAQVGVYSVATRLVVFASLIQTAINTSLGPRIADLYQRREHVALERAYRAAASWTVRLALPAFALLAIFPRELLSIFGPEFAVAAAVTIVLALGKLIDAVTGPCALMLNMSGRPLLNTINNLLVLVLNGALNVLLIPRIGLMGAAVAWTISLAAVNAARVIEVRVTMRMWPFDPAMLKGWLPSRLLPGPPICSGSRCRGLPGSPPEGPLWGWGTFCW